MDSKKPNKISEIVRLQRILKRWKKLATTPKPSTTGTTSPTTTAATANKSIKFLKKTLSFSDTTTASSPVSAISAGDSVPKGYLAVCVGKELRRFRIPTEYLAHQAFGILLREAEEEFGFQQEGVLKIPCDVAMFMKIVKMVEEKREVFFLHEFGFNLSDNNSTGCFSSPDNSELTPLSHHHHPQLCR